MKNCFTWNFEHLLVVSVLFWLLMRMAWATEWGGGGGGLALLEFESWCFLINIFCGNKFSLIFELLKLNSTTVSPVEKFFWPPPVVDGICSCCFYRHNELCAWAWSSEGKQTETLQFDMCRTWIIQAMKWNNSAFRFNLFKQTAVCQKKHSVLCRDRRLYTCSWHHCCSYATVSTISFGLTLCQINTNVFAKLCHEKMTWCSAQKKSYDAWRSCRIADDAEKYKFEIRIWTWSRVVEHNQNTQVHAEMSTSTTHSPVEQSLTEPYSLILTANNETVSSSIFWNNWCSCHTNYLDFSE